MSPSPARRPVFNLNSALALVTLSGVVFGAVKYLTPLSSLPDDMRAVRGDMSDVQRTQAVQTEALKTLAEVTRDSRDLRRDFDRTSADHAATLKRHEQELERLRR